MIELKIIIVTAVAVLLLWSHHYAATSAVDRYKDKQAIAQVKSDKTQQDKYNAIAESFESMRYAREEKAKVITKVVEKIVERDVYRNVCVDLEGVEAANAALRGDL